MKSHEMMQHYWNDGFVGLGWVLWLGFVVLIFSGIGNWGYSYSAHRKYDLPRNGARSILDERYARADITREQYLQLRSDISSE
jgi:uncharacterized membrane protein